MLFVHYAICNGSLLPMNKIDYYRKELLYHYDQTPTTLWRHCNYPFV